jgi:glutathione S-transferase
MKLYFSPASCALASHIVLHELGLPFELERVDLGKKVTASGADFLKVNPKGYVPALVLDNGQTLTEGAAILQYIADLKPAAGLVPANGTFERYKVQEWLTFIGTEIHKTFSTLFNPAAPAEAKEQAVATLGRRFTYVSGELQGKDYLNGKSFSIADAYLFTTLTWAQYVKVDLSPWPVLQQYVARISARPATLAALKGEGLIK